MVKYLTDDQDETVRLKDQQIASLLGQRQQLEREPAQLRQKLAAAAEATAAAEAAAAAAAAPAPHMQPVSPALDQPRPKLETPKQGPLQEAPPGAAALEAASLSLSQEQQQQAVMQQAEQPHDAQQAQQQGESEPDAQLLAAAAAGDPAALQQQLKTLQQELARLRQENAALGDRCQAEAERAQRAELELEEAKTLSATVKAQVGLLLSVSTVGPRGGCYTNVLPTRCGCTTIALGGRLINHSSDGVFKFLQSGVRCRQMAHHSCTWSSKHPKLRMLNANTPCRLLIAC